MTWANPFSYSRHNVCRVLHILEISGSNRPGERLSWLNLFVVVLRKILQRGALPFPFTFVPITNHPDIRYYILGAINSVVK
jgi:hypothetical protein